MLTDKGFTIDEKIDVAAEPDRSREMVERTGKMTVPQIFIDDFHVGGFDDLKALDDEGKLDEILPVG